MLNPVSCCVSKAFDGLRGEELSPGRALRSPRDLDAFLRGGAAVTSAYHPACTAPMGAASDPRAVCDAAGHVHGVGNLRVVDASGERWR